MLHLLVGCVFLLVVGIVGRMGCFDVVGQMVDCWLDVVCCNFVAGCLCVLCGGKREAFFDTASRPDTVVVCVCVCVCVCVLHRCCIYTVLRDVRVCCR